jgi:hypothetical protein
MCWWDMAAGSTSRSVHRAMPARRCLVQTSCCGSPVATGSPSTGAPAACSSTVPGCRRSTSAPVRRSRSVIRSVARGWFFSSAHRPARPGGLPVHRNARPSRPGNPRGPPDRRNPRSRRRDPSNCHRDPSNCHRRLRLPSPRSRTDRTRPTCTSRRSGRPSDCGSPRPPRPLGPLPNDPANPPGRDRRRHRPSRQSRSPRNRPPQRTSSQRVGL